MKAVIIIEREPSGMSSFVYQGGNCCYMLPGLNDRQVADQLEKQLNLTPRAVVKWKGIYEAEARV